MFMVSRCARIGRALKTGDWRHRLAVVRAADPDPWRNRLRDVLETKDPRV
jgi:hypothetical protein